jgi:CRP-like cAMP-binding protein
MATTTGLVENLPTAHRRRLLAMGRETEFDAHTRLFEEHGPASRFWLIRSGAVQVDTHVPGRRDAVVDTLGPGDVLGWSWMFPPYRWHFGAETVGRVRALEFDAEEVRRLCDADPEFGQALVFYCARIIADRLHYTRLRLLQLYGQQTSASGPGLADD